MRRNSAHPYGGGGGSGITLCGLFAFGAPDVQVVNVAKDAIWVRDAALPGMSSSPRPNPTEVFSGGPDTMPGSMTLPPVRRPREPQQDAYLREIEVDPHP